MAITVESKEVENILASKHFYDYFMPISSSFSLHRTLNF